MMTTNFLLMASLAILATGGAQYVGQTPIPIVSQSVNIGENGNYDFQYQTANGISAQEVGSRKYPGTEQESELVQGSFVYTAPDGTPIATSYTADDNGFQVAGSHIPVRPPIPPLIQRALDWIAANSQRQKDQQRI